MDRPALDVRRIMRSDGVHAFDQPDDGRHNGASGSAADQLADDRSDVDAAAGCACDRRNNGAEELSATQAADGTGNRVARYPKPEPWSRYHTLPQPAALQLEDVPTVGRTRCRLPRRHARFQVQEASFASVKHEA